MKHLKTDNSQLAEKLQLRRCAIEMLQKNKIVVLDAFSGEGALWNILGREYNIDCMGIDQKKNADIRGDNKKVLPVLDLSMYDIIDLDAYGNPFHQLKLVMDNKTLKKGTYIVYTYITTSYGCAPVTLMESIGITSAMYRKIRTLCSRKQRLAFDNYLSGKGVTEVMEYDIVSSSSHKKYGFFKNPE